MLHKQQQDNQTTHVVVGAGSTAQQSGRQSQTLSGICYNVMLAAFKLPVKCTPFFHTECHKVLQA